MKAWEIISLESFPVNERDYSLQRTSSSSQRMKNARNKRLRDSGTVVNEAATFKIQSYFISSSASEGVMKQIRGSESYEKSNAWQLKSNVINFSKVVNVENDLFAERFGSDRCAFKTENLIL